MKKNLLIIATAFLAVLMVVPNVKAQEWNTGLDIYSTYVWRGTAFSGPSIQPTVEFSAGGFSIGAWGSQGFDGFQEMDLYASYAFNFGLSIGITDYYYPGTPYFDYSKETGAHGFEINLGFEISNLSLSANYILNEAGGAETKGKDMYYEVGYTIGNVGLFVGAGDGWHTVDGNFGLCNLGLSTGKEIKVTDNFSIPVNGSVILNPEKEQFYVVVGISL
jgi:hypothetical protein